MLEEITPVILTRDEAPNIGRTLNQLGWAREIIVVDSGSTDDTLKIAAAFPNVRTMSRTLDDLAAQWTFAVAQATTPWVLTLDADYFVPESLARELGALRTGAELAAAECQFAWAVDGRLLRATLYPARAVLLRRDRCEFRMDGHTQRVQIEGKTLRLKERIIHDDRKPFSSFVARQRRYMRDEAEKLSRAHISELPLSGKIRKAIVIAPFAVFLYTLAGKGLLLDGTAGLRYVAERTIAECILSLEMVRRIFVRPST